MDARFHKMQRPDKVQSLTKNTGAPFSGLKILRYRIVTMPTPGMTAGNPFSCKPQAFDWAIFF